MNNRMQIGYTFDTAAKPVAIDPQTDSHGALSTDTQGAMSAEAAGVLQQIATKGASVSSWLMGAFPDLTFESNGGNGFGATFLFSPHDEATVARIRVTLEQNNPHGLFMGTEEEIYDD